MISEYGTISRLKTNVWIAVSFEAWSYVFFFQFSTNESNTILYPLLEFIKKHVVELKKEKKTWLLHFTQNLS
jgi:hypothetical protein